MILVCTHARVCLCMHACNCEISYMTSFAGIATRISLFLGWSLSADSRLRARARAYTHRIAHLLTHTFTPPSTPEPIQTQMRTRTYHMQIMLFPVHMSVLLSHVTNVSQICSCDRFKTLDLPGFAAVVLQGEVSTGA